MRVLFILLSLFFYTDKLLAADHSGHICNGRIGVLVPLQHESLDLIVDGLQKTIEASCSKNIVEVKNAQGDLKIQQLILKQFSSRKEIQYIATIGTVASQFAIKNSHKKVLALAANEKLISDGHYVISEEMPADDIAAFIENILPDAKQVAVVHSMNDKVFEECRNIQSALLRTGINSKEMIVNDIQDIYRVKNKISSDVDAVLILKDHVVVSAINLLSRQTAKFKIPLVALDEGSVKKGADIAIGVSERDIGVEGAELLLSQESNKRTIDNYKVFINSESKLIGEIGKKSILDNIHYPVIRISLQGGKR